MLVRAEELRAAVSFYWQTKKDSKETHQRYTKTPPLPSGEWECGERGKRKEKGHEKAWERRG
jgi:hypothetical protein